ncbi:hypothetical protein V676_01294, partial [Staphylococcus argenteus]
FYLELLLTNLLSAILLRIAFTIPLISIISVRMRIKMKITTDFVSADA